MDRTTGTPIHLISGPYSYFPESDWVRILDNIKFAIISCSDYVLVERGNDGNIYLTMANKVDE